MVAWARPFYIHSKSNQFIFDTCSVFGRWWGRLFLTTHTFHYLPIIRNSLYISGKYFTRKDFMDNTSLISYCRFIGGEHITSSLSIISPPPYLLFTDKQWKWSIGHWLENRFHPPYWIPGKPKQSPDRIYYSIKFESSWASVIPSSITGTSPGRQWMVMNLKTCSL